jgi:hypothetical protein
MLSIKDFQPGRFQDASAVLRGFRYQVDLTLLRWLALVPHEHLELERGEDIDLVAQALADESHDGYVRTLEQVKVRETKLTLRSSSALESLANAVSHLVANPCLAIRFCYTTNAKVARERPCPFPDKAAGIEVWEQIRRGAITAPQLTTVITALRQFLFSAMKPKKLPNATWAAFLQFVKSSDDVGFAGFIRRFEWSCAKPDAEDLSDSVRHQLRVHRNLDDLSAKSRYDQLFVAVFRLLTQGGIKQLTKQGLDEHLATPTLPESDHALLARLASRFNVLERRIDTVETALVAVSEEIHSLTRQEGIAATAIDTVGNVNLLAPPLVEHLSMRRQTVEDLSARIQDKDWLALYGSSDTGKTHLAELLARRLGNCPGWFRFTYDMSGSQASALLHDGLRTLAGTASQSATTDWYHDACSRLGPDACVVLDDLPNVAGAEPFGQRLLAMADACHASHVRIVSTSHFRLPVRLATGLGDERLLEIPVPPFSDAEARDVLAAHQAPEVVLSEYYVRFVNGLASGHPLLVTLAARFLKAHDWQLSNEAFSALLRGDHAVPATDEVLGRICQSLEPEHREFLYRLSLSTGAFPDTVATQLAAVPELINRPRERLATLLGAWIQREESQTLVVSPLVRGIGKDNLSSSTFRGCHTVFGDNIVRGRMSPWDAQIAITHFVLATEFDRAGTLFLSLLDRLRTWKPAPEFRSALATWLSLPLPTEMKLRLRLMIRAMQFWVLPMYGLSDEYVRRDLDELMGRATPAEAWSACVVACLAACFLSSRDFTRTIRYVCRAITLARNSTVTDRRFPLPQGRRFVELMWIPILNIESETELREWLSAYESLTAEERKIVAASKDARVGCHVLADRLMMVESQKPLDQRDWNGVLRVVHWLRERAAGLAWEELASAALCTELNIHGEVLRNVETCEETVQRFIQDDAHTQQAKASIKGMYGRMLAGAGKHQAAMPWLEDAVKVSVYDIPNHRMLTFLAASKSCAQNDRNGAVRYAEKAAEVARTDRSISDIEAMKAFAECAIAITRQETGREGVVRAFRVWEEAAERIFNISNRDTEWKDMFVLFCHVTGFLTTLVGTGHPPERTADGLEYAAPWQGMFFAAHPERASFFREETIPSIMWSMSHYAYEVHDEQSGAFWLDKATEAIEDSPMTYMRATIGRDLIADLLRADRFAEALDAGIRGAEMLVVGTEVGATSPMPIPLDAPLDSLVARLSVDARKRVDRFATILGIFPAMLRTATKAMSDREAASDSATELASLCRQFAPTAADSQFWLGSAQVFEGVAGNATVHELLEFSHSFDASQYRELRAVGYLASTLAGDAESAFHAQLAIMETVFAWHPPESPVHLKLLLPYVEMFWTETFRNKRFQFRSPSIVEEELANAVKSDAGQRVRAILRAVQFGFRSVGFQSAAKWLNEGPEGTCRPTDNTK